MCCCSSCASLLNKQRLQSYTYLRVNPIEHSGIYFQVSMGAIVLNDAWSFCNYNNLLKLRKTTQQKYNQIAVIHDASLPESHLAFISYVVWSQFHSMIFGVETARTLNYNMLYMDYMGLFKN